MIYGQVHLTLPPWIHTLNPEPRYPTATSKVALAIALSRRNVDERSGGPFGAIANATLLVAVGYLGSGFSVCIHGGSVRCT